MTKGAQLKQSFALFVYAVITKLLQYQIQYNEEEKIEMFTLTHGYFSTWLDGGLILRMYVFLYCRFKKF